MRTVALAWRCQLALKDRLLNGVGCPRGLTFRHSSCLKKIFFLSRALKEFGGLADSSTRVCDCSLHISSTDYESTLRDKGSWACLFM
jgi:hypothetical protein